jgi:hypothetical protein
MLGSKVGMPSVLLMGSCRSDHLLGRSCSGLEQEGNQGDGDVKHESLTGLVTLVIISAASMASLGHPCPAIRIVAVVVPCFICGVVT